SLAAREVPVSDASRMSTSQVRRRKRSATTATSASAVQPVSPREATSQPQPPPPCRNGPSDASDAGASTDPSRGPSPPPPSFAPPSAQLGLGVCVHCCGSGLFLTCSQRSVVHGSLSLHSKSTRQHPLIIL